MPIASDETGHRCPRCGFFCKVIDVSHSATIPRTDRERKCRRCNLPCETVELTLPAPLNTIVDLYCQGLRHIAEDLTEPESKREAAREGIRHARRTILSIGVSQQETPDRA